MNRLITAYHLFLNKKTSVNFEEKQGIKFNECILVMIWFVCTRYVIISKRIDNPGDDIDDNDDKIMHNFNTDSSWIRMIMTMIN